MTTVNITLRFGARAGTTPILTVFTLMPHPFGFALSVLLFCSTASAASTPQGQRAGLVFIHSRLTADAEVSEVFLGRPWRERAETVFLQCEMGAHIVPAGWHDWDKPATHQTTFYAEYQSSGPGAMPDKRVSWSHQIDEEASQTYDVESLLMRDGEAAWIHTHNRQFWMMSE